MLRIDTSPRISRPDDYYQMLIDAHAGLSDDDSMKLNAKLVLLLSNQIGDIDILAQAIELASEGIESSAQEEMAA